MWNNYNNARKQYAFKLRVFSDIMEIKSCVLTKIYVQII